MRNEKKKKEKNEREKGRTGKQYLLGKREYPGESGEIKKKARILDYLVREGGRGRI